MIKPKKPSEHLHHLSRAAKWMMVSITTMAAVIGLLVNARNLGLTPWLRTGSISFADLSARRVLLAPPADTLRAVGDTLHLAATVTDDRGATISGATIIWATDDSAVATVDSAGDVIARGAGTATISASVRDHRALSRIAVWQRVRSVAIAQDTLLKLAEGSSMALLARALDARGHPVRGRELKWTTADSTVVAVNAGGYARAASPGHTVLTAAVEGYTATLVAEVMLTPGSAQIVTGDRQRGLANQRLPMPVQVQVVSHGGRPVPNAEISFEPDNQEGDAEPAKGVTDKNGRLRSVWTLGPTPGPQELFVSVRGLDSVIAISAEADPVRKNTRIELVHEIPHATAGSRLMDTTKIRVTDSTGAALDNVPVTWTPLDGGSIEALAPRTGTQGEAWARWTLGPRAGKQRARVQVGNPRTMPAFTISTVALPDSAATMSVVSGGGQDGHAGAVLASPIAVRVTDRGGNPAAGATIGVMPLAGSVSDSAPVADSLGRIRVHWTLGRTSGAQQLELSVHGTTVKVTAHAAPLSAANIALSPLPDSAPAGRALAKAVAAVVTDVYGNVVPDALVIFTPASGAMSPARVMTGSKGTATTTWTLGKSAGEQALTVTVKGTSAKTSASVRATKKPAK